MLANPRSRNGRSARSLSASSTETEPPFTLSRRSRTCFGSIGGGGYQIDEWRRMLTLVRMSALLALALVSGITVGRAPDGRGARVEVSADVDAPLAAVEAVLLDLEHYPSWFPGMQSARLESARV